MPASTRIWNNDMLLSSPLPGAEVARGSGHQMSTYLPHVLGQQPGQHLTMTDDCDRVGHAVVKDYPTGPVRMVGDFEYPALRIGWLAHQVLFPLPGLSLPAWPSRLCARRLGVHDCEAFTVPAAPCA